MLRCHLVLTHLPELHSAGFCSVKFGRSLALYLRLSKTSSFFGRIGCSQAWSEVYISAFPSQTYCNLCPRLAKPQARAQCLGHPKGMPKVVGRGKRRRHSDVSTHSRALLMMFRWFISVTLPSCSVWCFLVDVARQKAPREGRRQLCGWASSCKREPSLLQCFSVNHCRLR